jgi:hypothetical protein
MAGFSKIQQQPALHVCLCRLCVMSLVTELSAVVFCQYIHPILTLVIFFFLGLFEGRS